MKPSKHYRPNSIYKDRAGTHYTVIHMPVIRGYYLVQLQPNGDMISNSIVVFNRWIKELKLIGSRKRRG